MPSHDARKVQGPMGRTFNRVLGKHDYAEDTADMAFSHEQLKEFLDEQLQLAEGEFFRGMKLDGVADALMERLDLDANGAVTWEEFQEFRQSIIDTIAPGLEESATEAQVEASANSSFDQVDANRNGSLAMGELQNSTGKALPAGTDHKDLVAQLGARMAIDAVDTDQRSSKVSKRTLTRSEWVKAAKQLTGYDGN